MIYLWSREILWIQEILSSAVKAHGLVLPTASQDSKHRAQLCPPRVRRLQNVPVKEQPDPVQVGPAPLWGVTAQGRDPEPSHSKSDQALLLRSPWTGQRDSSVPAESIKRSRSDDQIPHGFTIYTALGLPQSGFQNAITTF